ncbi:MAG TPA: 3-oxo-5-alpha-steroid 4-dehydrogenase [Pseudomonadales bacterium]|jgi:3-oxo-5-alpha-steroid 4-dehydrogenase 1
MTVVALYQALLWFIVVMSVAGFAGSFFYTTPYGRFKKATDEWTLPSRAGWLLMEFPCLLAFALTYWLLGTHSLATVPLLVWGVWQTHYIYRSIIFPLRMRDHGKRMPMGAVAFGFVFNSINGFLNGYAVSSLAPHLLDTAWLLTPWFMGGAVLMLVGVTINIQSDAILRHLRQPGETGYKIPHGGLYRWISVPNYLGEIIEWTGWAMLTATPAGWSFALFSFANLFPRALAHHRWYQKTFSDYPSNRKAIIPGII